MPASADSNEGAMNKSHLRLIAIFAVAGLGGAVVFADPPPDSPRVKTVKAIAELSEHLDATDVVERAKKIVAEYDSCDISNFFMVKRRGGFGIGKLAKTENQNAVQFLVPQ